MIIDKNIDKSLLLILNTDKKNRDRIVNFVCNIPDDLKKLIQNRFDILEKNRGSLENRVSLLCGEFVTDDGLLYWFEIQPEFNEIDLGYKKSNGFVYEDMFEMTLSLNNDLFLLSNFEKQYIGRIEYDKKINIVHDVGNILEFSENIYNLYKIPFGYIITSSYNKEIVDFRCFGFGSIASLNDELFLNDRSKKKKLVRGKRK